MSVRSELQMQLLQAATQIYCVRVGELIPVDPSAEKLGHPVKKVFDHNDAVREAARLIHAVATNAELAFGLAAQEAKAASIYTAAKN
jgi:hypothetical protein